MNEWNLAEVKAQLAQAGAQLEPDAVLNQYERPRPGQRTRIVLVEAITSIEGHPDYCIHGFASCVVCDVLCYLGSATVLAVTDRGAFPMCLNCAEGRLNGKEPVGRLVDERNGGRHD